MSWREEGQTLDVEQRVAAWRWVDPSNLLRLSGVRVVLQKRVVDPAKSVWCEIMHIGTSQTLPSTVACIAEKMGSRLAKGAGAGHTATRWIGERVRASTGRAEIRTRI